jgi:DNA-binding SARP family transcriptional activator/WD40 repeat protein
MQIQVLGTIDVLDPAEVALGGPTQRRVLSALLLHSNRVVSVDQLVDAVWPDGEVPERAEHNVRTYVHRLRTALGEAGDRIETAGTGYRLRVERDELDATRFEDLVDRARELAAGADADGARQLLDEALGLWRGRPFDEFADEEWTRAEVTRLGEVRASAVEHRFAALLDAGRHTEVVGPLQEAVTAEPWREARRVQLALALYRSGRQAEALRAIQHYRSELADEIGLVPSTELDELEHRILDHDPTLVPASHRRHMLHDYQLDEVIGEGAFSLVWRGTQPSLGRKVAIKQIRAELANQPDFVRRFETEAQTVAALEHPHIVPLYDYWREPDSAYLVMRYIAGGSLESEVLDRGLDEARLRRLVDQVGSALYTAHRVGVIHRDVKSANVLLDAEGNFYLTDFGIAFTGSAADDELATALSTGSPAYASPEQLRRQALDSRTDVYGFGITLFEAATGRLPFVDAPTQAALVKRQLEDPVPTPSSVTNGVPAWVDQLVARATAKNPADRFGSMAELMAAVPDGSAGTTDRGHRVAVATVVGDLVNPFKALRAFREADAADFYGRDRLVARFVDVLGRPGSAGRLLAVVGPSGSGKSSAVRSGLLPRLRTGAVPGSDDWFITTMLPGSHPFDELESALSRVAVRQPGPLVEMMRGDDRGIARAINQILPDEDSELLLVIDQFEELFTHTVDAERTRFLAGLLTAVQEPRTRLRVVVTIRADFLDGPLRHPQLASRLETATVTVSPLAADELEAAIVEPVRRQGAAYEPGLVARILADVGDQPGALPLLQYALTELFDANVAGLLQTESYEAIGGLTGALASRAEDTLTAMPPDQQAVARRVFGRLVTLGDGTEDTRRRVRRRELGGDDDTNHVIDTFGTARLLVFDHDTATREPTVEIAHEALLRAWPRLRSWLDDDRDDLRTLRGIGSATDAWLASGRDDGELARSGRLDTVSEFSGRRPDVLNERELEWVTASQAAAAAADRARTEAAVRDRRQNRRLRQLLAAAACLVVVALVAAGTAVVQRNRAVDSERSAVEAQNAALAAEAEAVISAEEAVAAQQAAVSAEDAAVAAQAEAVTNAEQAIAAEQDADIERLTALSAAQIGVAPDIAILLALEANRRRDDVGTQGAVQTAIATEPRLSRVIPKQLAGLTETTFSGDGTVGVTWSVDDGTFIWFDAETGEPLGQPFSVGRVLDFVEVSGDGSVIAFASADQRTVVVRRDGDEMSTLLEVDGFPVALDRSGNTIAIAASSDLTHFIEVPSGNVRSSHRHPANERPMRFKFLDDGDDAVLWWQLGDFDPHTGGGIDVIGTTTGERRARFLDDGEPTATAVSTDGRIITGYADGAIVVRTIPGTAAAADDVRIAGHSRAVGQIALGPDGVIVTAGADRTVRFWSADGARRPTHPIDIAGAGGFGALGVGATGVTVAQTSGGMVRIETNSRPIVEATRSAVGFGLSPDAAWWWSPVVDPTTEIDDPTVLRLTHLDGDDQRDIDLRAVHPTGFYFVKPSIDGEWVLTAGDAHIIGVSEVAGDRQTAVDLGPTLAQLGITEELPVMVPRAAAGGERLFVLIRKSDDSWLAVWIDIASEEIVAGPLELPSGGGSRILQDGSVVVGGDIAPLMVLPPGLDGEPTILPDVTGLSALHQDPVSGLVLVGGGDGAVGLLDPRAGRVEFLEGAVGWVYAGAFSPSGDTVAISSDTAGVQLFDVASRQPIGMPMVPQGGAIGGAGGLRWSEDGRGVWIGPAGGPVRFAAHPDSWREIACSIVGRELTPDEWRTFVSDTDPQVSACT